MSRRLAITGLHNEVRPWLALLWLVLVAQCTVTRSSASEYFNVRDYGATGDTTELATVSIQETIDACHDAGGGIVYFPPGDYLSAMIVLKSHVSIHLDSGATLYASRNKDDYADPTGSYGFPALIHAYQAHNIGIIGSGTIHGQAETTYEELKKVDPFIDTITENARLAGVEMKMHYMVPPRVFSVFFNDCEDVVIEDVSMVEGTFWTCHLLNCTGVLIRNARIHSSLETGVNVDGIDINACRNVLIEGCEIITGDDAIALKSWPNQKQACENIVVNNCVLSSSSTALKIGTKSHGDFRNIVFSNCVITNSNRGLSIVISDGGNVDKVLFSNTSIECNRRHFNWWGNADPIWIMLHKRAESSETGSIRDVSFKNIIANGRGTSRVESRVDQPLENIRFRNVHLQMSEEDYPDKRAHHALYADNVESLSIKNLSVNWDEDKPEPNWGSALFIENVRDLSIKNFDGRQGLIGSAYPVIHLKNVKDAKVKRVNPTAGAGEELRIEN